MTRIARRTALFAAALALTSHGALANGLPNAGLYWSLAQAGSEATATQGVTQLATVSASDTDGLAFLHAQQGRLPGQK